MISTRYLSKFLPSSLSCPIFTPFLFPLSLKTTRNNILYILSLYNNNNIIEKRNRSEATNTHKRPICIVYTMNARIRN